MKEGKRELGNTECIEECREVKSSLAYISD